MIFRPTNSQRNVVLLIQATEILTPNKGTHHMETLRISRILGLFADEDKITEGLFDQPDEVVLLNRFWQAINANDRIFGNNIESTFALARRRSWQLNIVPSPDITLQRVYSHEF